MYALGSFITLNVGNCYFMHKDGHDRSAQYATYRKLTPAAYYIKRSVQCSIVTIKVVGCSSGPYRARTGSSNALEGIGQRWVIAGGRSST